MFEGVHGVHQVTWEQTHGCRLRDILNGAVRNHIYILLGLSTKEQLRDLTVRSKTHIQNMQVKGWILDKRSLTYRQQLSVNAVWWLLILLERSSSKLFIYGERCFEGFSCPKSINAKVVFQERN